MKRCNKILDTLEKINDTKCFAIGTKTTMRVIQFPTELLSEIILPTGDTLRFQSLLSDFDGDFAQYFLFHQNRLLEDGLLESPPSSVEFIPVSMSISEFQSIQETIFLNDKYHEIKFTLYHFHELAGDCIFSSIRSFDSADCYHIVLSLNHDVLQFSIFQLSSNSINFLFHSLIPIILSPDIVPQLVEQLDPQLLSSNLSFSGPFTTVWCLGQNRKDVHHSISPFLTCLKSFTLDPGVQFNSDHYLPNVSVPSLFSCPPHSLSTTKSLHTLGISSSGPRCSAGFIPFIEPQCSLSSTCTRRVVCHLKHQAFLRKDELVMVEINIIEVLPSKSSDLLISMSLLCPSSIIYFSADHPEGSIALDVTLHLATTREVNLTIEPLAFVDEKLIQISYLDERRLAYTLDMRGRSNVSYTASTIMGDFSFSLSPSKSNPTVWICEDISSQYKQMGNNCMTSGDIHGAVCMYTTAINSDPQNGILYSNRCAAFTKLGKYSHALNDANECVRLLPEWEKGWSRRGGVLSRLGQLEEAILCYEKGDAFLFIL